MQIPDINLKKHLPGVHTSAPSIRIMLTSPLRFLTSSEDSPMQVETAIKLGYTHPTALIYLFVQGIGFRL